MTDTAAAPTAEQIAAARALVAEADAKEAADRKARDDAATQAVKDLVASAEFKAARTAFEAANVAAPKNTEVNYTVQMLDRLATAFGA